MKSHKASVKSAASWFCIFGAQLGGKVWVLGEVHAPRAECFPDAPNRGIPVSTWSKFGCVHRADYVWRLINSFQKQNKRKNMKCSKQLQVEIPIFLKSKIIGVFINFVQIISFYMVSHEWHTTCNRFLSCSPLHPSLGLRQRWIILLFYYSPEVAGADSGVVVCRLCFNTQPPFSFLASAAKERRKTPRHMWQRGGIKHSPKKTIRASGQMSDWNIMDLPEITSLGSGSHLCLK